MRTRLLLGLLMVVPGCSTPPAGWDSPEPAARLGAITEAAKTNDRASIPHLIQALEHDDPVVRLAAIRTLEQLTGQTLGYDYAAPEWDRRDKIAAWVAWYKASDNQREPVTGEHARGSVGPIESRWARR